MAFCHVGIAGAGCSDWCMGSRHARGDRVLPRRAGRRGAVALRGVRGRGRCDCFGGVVGADSGEVGGAGNWCVGSWHAGIAQGVCADWCMEFCRARGGAGGTGGSGAGNWCMGS
jgi:hypothetical protein